MPIIKITAPLRPYVNNKAEVPVNGQMVSDVLNDLFAQYPAFKPQLCKDDGTLRAFVNLFLNGQNIRELQGMNTILDPDDILSLIPAIAGG